MRASVASLIVAAALLAGCASDPPEPSQAAAGDGPQFSEDRGRGNVTVDAVGLPREPPAPGERRVNEAPTWRLGEWWSYRITTPLTGDTYEVVRVVGGTEHGNFLVGFPIDQFSNEVLVLHTPGYGDIVRSDLSYGAHDVPFVPLRFPLVEGDTWQSAWEAECATGQILVEEVDLEQGFARLLASADADACNGRMAGEFIYDFDLGEIRELHLSGYADYVITDHGFAYEGDIRVPHAHDLIFFHGRVAGLSGIDPVGSVQTSITETVTVGPGYDRLSFATLLQDVAGSVVGGATGTDGVTAGVLRLTATAPDGTVYQDTLTPADLTAQRFSFYSHDGPQGDWTVESIAAGAGVAAIEGIGYHSIDISLPSGCVLFSQNALHHGTLCREAGFGQAR